ncbi:MAG TPA: hypothetical protein VFQ38_13595 [Longimicrobiales bacterium]|nr:hypothetical protein [Longimicrobiales bacterium]
MSTATAERRGSRPALWFGLLGAAAAWSVQEIVAYALVAHSCYPRTEPLAEPSLGGTWILAVGVTSLALLTALAGLWISFRLWRGYQPDPRAVWRAEVVESTQARANPFLAFSGVLLSAIFTALIVYNAVAILLVPVCGW